MNDICDLCGSDAYGSSLELKLRADIWGDFLQHCGLEREPEGGRITIVFCLSCVFSESDVNADEERGFELLKQLLGIPRIEVH